MDWQFWKWMRGRTQRWLHIDGFKRSSVAGIINDFWAVASPNAPTSMSSRLRHTRIQMHKQDDRANKNTHQLQANPAKAAAVWKVNWNVLMCLWEKPSGRQNSLRASIKILAAAHLVLVFSTPPPLFLLHISSFLRPGSFTVNNGWGQEKAEAAQW